MTKQEAQGLAETIKRQFPHVEADFYQSIVRSGSWIVEVRRREVPPESQALLLYSEEEWQDMLLALAILRK